MTSEPTVQRTPRLFISYRWSSPQHEEWVLNFATNLRSDGIDVILDKWHLREGHDAFAFMERMVNDQSVTKVLLICDAGYVERADQRAGGVGTEAQIVSREVYEKVDQTKFAAAAMEMDEGGRPLLPTYLSSRIYFDFTSENAISDNYEKVLRWCFDKPFHPVPPLGLPPKYLDETFQSGINLVRASNALRTAERGSGGSMKAAASALSSVIETAKELCLSLVDEPEPDERIVETIEQATPLREQAIRAMDILIQSSDETLSIDKIHMFLEDLLHLRDYGIPNNGMYNPVQNDALKFFSHTLFVSFLALSFKRRNFYVPTHVLSMPFFSYSGNQSTGSLCDYSNFDNYLRSLEDLRRNRLSLNRISVQADYIKNSFSHSIVGFGEFMEADLTLYLRGLLSENNIGSAPEWRPISLVYASRLVGAFPIYARATSDNFFNKLRPLLLGASADQVREVIRASRVQTRSQPECDGGCEAYG